jgi:protein involved in polysaccharide export with SLBB domain
VLQIHALGVLLVQPVDGHYLVEPDGNVALGPGYGRANVDGLTAEQAEQKITQQLKKIVMNPDVQVVLARRPNRWREAKFPRLPYTINPIDVLQVRVWGTLLDQPIDGFFLVEPAGTIPLGPAYGRVHLRGLSLEAAEMAIQKKLEPILKKPDVQVTLPSDPADSPAVHWQDVAMPKAPYTIKPGDLLFIDAIGLLPDQPIQGVYLVEPAGTVPLGPSYGRAEVQNLSLEGAEQAIKKKLQEVAGNPEVSVTLAGWVDENMTFTRETHKSGEAPLSIPPSRRRSPQTKTDDAKPVER